MAIDLKSPAEVEAMREAGRVVARVLSELGRIIAPGISTLDLDRTAAEVAATCGAVCAFKGLYGFPANLCTSVNEVVVHGIPRADAILREGDIVGCDFGAYLDGWYGDGARTYPVGKVRPEVEHLLATTEEALGRAISVSARGYRVSDIGHAVQTLVEGEGFSVVRNFVGHGIGRRPHEDPQVPNFGPPGKGRRLKPGMVLALEPMVNMGTEEVETLEDGWTVVTRDRKWSAHFEHTVAVTASGPVILTLP